MKPRTPNITFYNVFIKFSKNTKWDSVIHSNNRHMHETDRQTDWLQYTTRHPSAKTHHACAGTNLVMITGRVSTVGYTWRSVVSGQSVDHSGHSIHYDNCTCQLRSTRRQSRQPRRRCVSRTESSKRDQRHDTRRPQWGSNAQPACQPSDPAWRRIDRS